ncbi:MAG: PAS domain-containing protein [Opitutales bacterium]|nr:PAS domain-containing protein [Opitutales bacterium]
MQKKFLENIPAGFLRKWQEIADLVAHVVGVPAALVMKTENQVMEVLTSSQTENNPYREGGKEDWHGLYCETVIRTQKKLRIPNALKIEKWKENPDVKLGMIAYLGYPISFPDHRPFGTFCVLDNKERHFTAENEKLLLQFKRVIELDLALIFNLGLKGDYSHADVIKRLTGENERYQAAVEDLRRSEEALKISAENLEHSYGLLDYIIKHNRCAVAVHDRDLKYIYVSQRYLDDYRVEVTNVIGKHHYEVFPDLPQKWRDVHQKALSGEVSSAERDPFYREDGSVDWTRWECRPWFEADGSIGGIIIYSEIINERIEAEEALKDSEERFRVLHNASFGGIAIHDKESSSNAIRVSPR